MKEAKKERIGSEVGDTLLKVTKKAVGISMKGTGTPYELIAIASTLVDNVAVTNAMKHEDVLEMVIENLFLGNSLEQGG